MSEEQGNVLGNVRFSEMTSNDYMKTLFLDPKKNVYQKTLASNRNKGFIYMVKNENKCKISWRTALTSVLDDNQVLRLGNRKQSKFERLKKLNKKMQEIVRNAE